MFTGIVEELGSVVSVETPPSAGNQGSNTSNPPITSIRIRAGAVLDDAAIGASIAVNGCCLTVTDFMPGDADEPGWWTADLSAETLDRTSLGSLTPGAPVNLERPVRLADRLGGHLVQGHVDGVGEVIDRVPDLRVRVPENLLRYVVTKGSVTVDGVSLTVVDLLGDGFTVAVIPHTAEVTTLGTRAPGDAVNLEVDVTIKYVERLIEWKDR